MDDTKQALDLAILNCRLCPGLNIPMVNGSAPAFGSVTAPLFILGQSLMTYNAAAEPGPQRPFNLGLAAPKWDSGRLLERALKMSGLWPNKFIATNIVHCHPPGNRASTPEEVSNCSGYWQMELALVKPKLLLILGRDAQKSVELYIQGVTEKKHLPTKLKLAMTGEPSDATYGDFTLKVAAMYHPAYIVRQRRPKAELAWLRTFVELTNTLGE